MINKKLGKIAVLMGGWSAEREVSLKSGKAVLIALQNKGLDAYGIDVGKNIASELLKDKPDVAFNILHGRGGEDGVIQAMLELLDIPYTGSGVLGSALSMDKVRTKQIWQANRLDTPEYFVITNKEQLKQIEDVFSGSYMVKPAHEGSSIGISKVDEVSGLTSAWEIASKYDDTVLVEKYIDGVEYSVSILNGQALPAIRLNPKNTFYDFEAKYISDETEYQCPCGLPQDTEQEMQNIALAAFNSLSCTGWGRVDFIMDTNGKPWLIENNTLPGMTDHSLVPMAANAAGISFDELVYEILTTAVTKNA